MIWWCTIIALKKLNLRQRNSYNFTTLNELYSVFTATVPVCALLMSMEDHTKLKFNVNPPQCSGVVLNELLGCADVSCIQLREQLE